MTTVLELTAPSGGVDGLEGASHPPLRRYRRLLASAVLASGLVVAAVIHLQVDLSTLWSPALIEIGLRRCRACGYPAGRGEPASWWPPGGCCWCAGPSLRR